MSARTAAAGRHISLPDTADCAVALTQISAAESDAVPDALEQAPSRLLCTDE